MAKAGYTGYTTIEDKNGFDKAYGFFYSGNYAGYNISAGYYVAVVENVMYYFSMGMCGGSISEMNSLAQTMFGCID